MSESGPAEGPSCYFDLSMSDLPPSKQSTPLSPGALAPAEDGAELAFLVPVDRRARSDYNTMLRRVHIQTIEEDLSDGLAVVHADTSNNGCPSGNGLDVDQARTEKSQSRGKAKEPSQLPHPISSVSANATNARSARENHAYPPRRPRLGHMWARTQSGSIWFETRRSNSERHGFSSSSDSNVHLSTSDTLRVRTEQLPLKPPPSKRPLSPTISAVSNIKVETSFSDAENLNTDGYTALEDGNRTHKSSTSLRRLFSASLDAIHGMSLGKRPSNVAFTRGAQQAPISRPGSRMADHSSLLKRNYTSDALNGATAILQDVKHSTVISLRLPTIKPRRLRAWTDLSIAQRDRKDVRTVGGITSQFTMVQRKSLDALSEAPSYTSSQVNMRMGPQPANTPAENATYKVKRSPSAETEEFLKVDISVRGGTSYLPSEARRIHTPPLPEETLDGRLKGFFFDYNAPRSEKDFQAWAGCNNGGNGESASTRSGEGERRSRSTTLSQRLHKMKSRKCKRFHASEWYDVKLAELDVEADNGQCPDNSGSVTDFRVFSPASFAQMQKTKEDERFDYSIPEHLPTSPLCPRNPRYWRVVKKKGSQFRGCWMHGIGEYDVVPGIKVAPGSSAFIEEVL